MSDTKHAAGPPLGPPPGPPASTGGLAAALGRSPAGNAATPTGAGTGGSGEDWTLFGIDTVAQLAAENAAHAAGQSVGAWLSALIAEAIADEDRG